MSKMLEIIEPDFSFNDERGSFNQLCAKGWEHVNVSTSKSGSFRGGHFHKESKEAFFIINGEFDLTLEKDGKVEKHSFKAGDFFVVYPYTLHSFDFKADTTMVALYDKSIVRSDGTKDIFNRGE